MSIRLTPIDLDTARRFVAMWHRHHGPPVGHKFSIGVQSGTVLVGVVIVGRPVARTLDDGQTAHHLHPAGRDRCQPPGCRVEDHRRTASSEGLGCAQQATER